MYYLTVWVFAFDFNSSLSATRLAVVAVAANCWPDFYLINIFVLCLFGILIGGWFVVN